jgi:hypothetical protein
LKERLLRLALAVAALAMFVYGSGIGDFFPNGLKWG